MLFDGLACCIEKIIVIWPLIRKLPARFSPIAVRQRGTNRALQVAANYHTPVATLVRLGPIIRLARFLIWKPPSHQSRIDQFQLLLFIFVEKLKIIENNEWIFSHDF